MITKKNVPGFDEFKYIDVCVFNTFVWVNYDFVKSRNVLFSSLTQERCVTDVCSSKLNSIQSLRSNPQYVKSTANFITMRAYRHSASCFAISLNSLCSRRHPLDDCIIELKKKTAQCVTHKSDPPAQPAHKR